MRPRLVLSCLLLAHAFTPASLVAAQPAEPAPPLDIAQAMERARSAPGPVRSAQLNAQARAMQAEALRNIHLPSVGLTGFSGRVRNTFNIDTALISNSVNPLLGQIGPATGFEVPPIPSVVAFEREYSLSSLSLAGVWPLYTGGRLDALRDVAAGRAEEAQAELQEETDKSATAVAERYFSVQLARDALRVRQAALAGVRQHLDAARRLESIGLIARAERLKADVALAEAERDAAKADSDVQLAEVALARQLGLAAPPALTTPLFAHAQPVGTLQSFIDAAMASNPAWSRIAAKRNQADAARRLAGSELSPTLLGVGSYNINRSSERLADPTFFVGLMVRVPIFGPVDRRAVAEAARLDQERVELAAQQAERDLPTLVENHWRAMEHARRNVLALGAQIELARESLRLQEVAFSQQQATALDVIDARLALAKAQVQRSQAAHDYVLALARLLEVTGQPDRLGEYAQGADLKLAFGLE